MPTALAVSLVSELPATLAVGRGTCLFLAGSCAHPDRRLRGLTVSLDGVAHPLTAYGMSAPLADGFWGFLPIAPLSEPRRALVELVASLPDGATARHRLGEVELLPALEPIEADPQPVVGEGPLVAVCMATFEPHPELLRRQLDSLREQTHRRWVCLVSDDCSSGDAFELLRSEVGEDPRFFLSRAPQRLGSYRNFERSLLMVPPAAELIAFCDQDDRWHPDKLEVLIERIGDANLVYSDMRVLDAEGRVASDTFWTYKRNNWRNVASLLIDNTVTGAASLFRRSLLDLAMPFPPPMEGAHHDHWIAQVALVTGRIAYVDRPLYDYVQHGAAATPLHPSTERAPAAAGPRDRLAEGQLAYFKDLCRIALSARVLRMRTRRVARPPARRTLRRLARLSGPREPVAWLALRALRPLIGRNETLYSERSLLKAISWRRLAARRTRREPSSPS
jgi:glycosyltransferase involved in cell wall biosynthesis